MPAPETPEAVRAFNVRRKAGLERQRQQHQSEVRREVRKSLATNFAGAEDGRRGQAIKASFFDLTGQEIDLQKAEPEGGEDLDLRFGMRKALPVRKRSRRAMTLRKGSRANDARLQQQRLKACRWTGGAGHGGGRGRNGRAAR